MVNLQVTRDGAAFALLNAENSLLLHRRMQEEDKRAEMEAAKQEEENKNNLEVSAGGERGRERLSHFSHCSCHTQDDAIDVQSKGYKKKSPWGQWVQYNDKRGRGIFYYNLVPTPPLPPLPLL